ncbi:MAG: helix-turn-helix domain-containing protein [Streptomyces sp.]|uniref:helix-turn-helix domain-containing protein n=1 Tax=Streptomyces sp. TaxID=1931 RepID=UPI003D6B4CF8
MNGQPPAAWRYCGNQVKLWRTLASVSRETLGETAGYAADTVKSMEQGVRMPTPKLLDTADELFHANGLLGGEAVPGAREVPGPIAGLLRPRS